MHGSKLNLQKSQLTGQTFTFEKSASGTLHFDSMGFAYDFKGINRTLGWFPP
jgi:hypothetical protein